MDSVLPAPQLGFRAEAATFLETGAARMTADLRRHGLALVHLDQPLANKDFQQLGSLLGTAIPETDGAVQPYVDDGVILNLVADKGQTQDVSLQPFATNALSLHSEGSGRSTADQPRYIVLMCVEPGDASAASTVLVPMAAVDAGLSEEERRLLAATRYHSAPGVPTIARFQQGRTVFSFRDFQGSPLRWACVADGAGEQSVNGALRRLLAQMYDPGHARAVSWSRGLLVVIDNTWFFHGRTAGVSRTTDRPRHIKRLRIR
ncbi:TauD/TfdA family dioxygenase [Streptomyces echinoruber]|uniref:TauD/TfdA family dioxygenase n=1 Tax=Streptomyces echinoruber TaxID=68898 RepID=UPI00167BC28B|nr:TauD/TfdA family dioxygenase [Streptomyces echinoruber]